MRCSANCARPPNASILVTLGVFIKDTFLSTKKKTALSRFAIYNWYFYVSANEFFKSASRQQGFELAVALFLNTSIRPVFVSAQSVFVQ
jgi:hypothetical protein